jgi:hypothetical protein
VAERGEAELDGLQRRLQAAREAGDRAQEAAALEALRAQLAALGDRRRAELIEHYRRRGFRPRSVTTEPARPSAPTA